MDSNSNEAKIWECRSKLMDACLAVGKDIASLQLPAPTELIHFAARIRLNDEVVKNITSEKVLLLLFVFFWEWLYMCIYM